MYNICINNNSKGNTCSNNDDNDYDKDNIYTEPQKKRRNFNNSIRYGKQSIYFFSLNYKFLLQHNVGTHHKKLSNNKLPLHQNFIITHKDNFIVHV